ncbi:MAG: hypothetical protein IKM49_01845 [Ruminococcus sp.]|nr:hypothetical protein [Ruminococcus sp.]
MLEIQEKFSYEGYESIAERAQCADAFHITEAIDKGEITGFIAYEYCNDKTVIYDYSDGNDLMLCDGLIRSVLFKTCLKGIERVDFELDANEKYTNLIKLRFLRSGEKTLTNPDSFMNSCQSCKSKGKTE